MRTHSLSLSTDEQLAAYRAGNKADRSTPPKEAGAPKSGNLIVETYLAEAAKRNSSLEMGLNYALTRIRRQKEDSEAEAQATADQKAKTEAEVKRHQEINRLHNAMMNTNIYGSSYKDPVGQVAQLDNLIEETGQLFQNALKNQDPTQAVSPELSHYLGNLGKLRDRLENSMDQAQQEAAHQENEERLQREKAEKKKVAQNALTKSR